MALPPISGQAVQPQGQSSAQTTRSVADARAAQRAFFEAALNKAQAPAVARPVQQAAVVAAPRAAAQPATAIAAAPAEAAPNRPMRPMRPGSLVNIVV